MNFISYSKYTILLKTFVYLNIFSQGWYSYLYKTGLIFILVIYKQQNIFLSKFELLCFTKISFQNVKRIYKTKAPWILIPFHIKYLVNLNIQNHLCCPQHIHILCNILVCPARIPNIPFQSHSIPSLIVLFPKPCLLLLSWIVLAQDLS